MIENKLNICNKIDSDSFFIESNDSLFYYINYGQNYVLKMSDDNDVCRTNFKICVSTLKWRKIYMGLFDNKLMCYYYDDTNNELIKIIYEENMYVHFYKEFSNFKLPHEFKVLYNNDTLYIFYEDRRNNLQVAIFSDYGKMKNRNLNITIENNAFEKGTFNVVKTNDNIYIITYEFDDYSCAYSRTLHKYNINLELPEKIKIAKMEYVGPDTKIVATNDDIIFLKYKKDKDNHVIDMFICDSNGNIQTHNIPLIDKCEFTNIKFVSPFIKILNLYDNPRILSFEL